MRLSTAPTKAPRSRPTGVARTAMHSNRASAKVPQRAPRIKKSTVHFRRQRVPRGRERPPCRAQPGRPAGRRLAALGGSDVDAIYRNRGCITDVREERERKTLAVGAAQERRTASTPGAAPAARLRHGFAAVCAALAPLLCPAPAQAGDDYDALILRARRRPPTGAGHAARPGSPAAARHPGPHPGGQLGGRPDADLRAPRAQPPADVRLAVARAARPAPLAGSAGAVPRRHARLSQPAFAAGIAMTLADADRLDELAAGEQLVRARPGTRTPTWPWPMSMHAGIRRLKRCATDARARPGARRRVEREYVFALHAPHGRRVDTPRAGPSCTRKRRCAGCRPTRWPSRCAWPRCRRATRPTGSRSPIASWRTTR